MMKRLSVLLFPALMIFLLQSCVERIDFELNNDELQRLVVEGWMTDQLKQHEVRLTLTSSYYEAQPAPAATGAFVTISDGNELWELSESAPGIYLTPEIQGEPLKTYTLNISYEGENYKATSYMRGSAPIDSLNIYYLDPLEEFGFDLDPWWDVRIWFQEPLGVGDGYMWITHVNGVSIRDTLSSRSFVEDGPYDGNYIGNVPIDLLEIDVEAFPGDTIFVEQWNIGYDAYVLLNGIMNETVFNGGLFDAPPANVETNISNGALGFFGAASVTSATAYVPQ